MASTVEQSNTGSWRDRRCGGHWTGLNIAVMVVSFVFFWPLGLVVLYWTLKGRNVKELPGAIRERVGNLTGLFGGDGHGTKNVVFDEYQQTQYDRIREIKAEIKERSDRFNEFRADARRRADQEEFERFMASSPVSK